MTNGISGAIKRIDVDDYSNPFPGYPAATSAGGLLFVSGVRGGRDSRKPSRFGDLPSEGCELEQGFFIADLAEGEVAADAWETHTNLDHLLTAAGSKGDQVLRQHIWQRDKRFFPVYETTRMYWQPTPSPSSGIGVTGLPGHYSHWYGITGIATLEDPESAFGTRRVLTPFDNPGLPSASFYSQAVASGPLAFLAGFIPVKTNEPGKPVVMGYDDVPAEGRFLQRGRSHPDSRDGPIASQAWYVLDEIRKVLEGIGSSLSDIVLLTVFLQDVRDFATFHRVYRHFFPEGGPALSVMNFNEVGHRGTLIEVEPTALLAHDSVKRRQVDWSGVAPFAAPAAVAAGPFIFFSGVMGYDEDGSFPMSGRELRGDQREIALLAEPFEHTPGTAAQSVLSIERLRQLSEQAGAHGLAGVAKMCVYFRHEADFAAFETVRRLMHWSELPASDFVAVPNPGPVWQASVQIEAIGYSG